MAEKILVTGGAGYIGAILVPELIAQGYEVTVVDNFLYRQNSLASVCASPKFTVVNGDVRDQALMRRVVQDKDTVIPLAALVGAPLCQRDPIAATTVNKYSVELLLKLLSPAQRVLMPTTNSAYGKGGANNYCDESTPLNPISRYAIDKVAVERKLLERGNCISFRLATVFGMSPRMRIDLLVNDFTYRAVYDRFVVLFESKFKRNYIHVRDVTRAFLHGLRNFESMKNEVYNVGLSTANISKWELCERIKEQLPNFVFLDAPVGKDPDQRDYLVSNEKIESTGFRPEYSIEAGISELLKGFSMIKNSRFGNV